MSRFYKTSNPTFVDDLIFKLPYEEIASVIGKKDGDIDDIYENIKEFKNQLQAVNLSEDDTAVNGLINSYQKEISGAQEALQGNYAGYSKIVPTIKGISSRLDKDASGILAAAKENKEDFDKEEAKLDARTDVAGDIRDGYKDWLRDQYGKVGALNYNNETGEYNRIKDLTKVLVADVDEEELIGKVQQGFNSDRKTSGGYRSKDGDYWEYHNFSREFIDPKDVKDYFEKTLPNSDWEAAKRQELQFRRKLEGDELENVLQIEKENLVNRAVNKIAFSKTLENSKSLQTKVGAEARAAKKAAENTEIPTFRDQPLSLEPKTLTYTDEQGRKKAVEMPILQGNKSNLAKTKERYQKGQKLLIDAYGFEEGEKMTSAKMAQIRKNSSVLFDFVNNPMVYKNPATLADANTAFSRNPVVTNFTQFADGSLTNLTHDYLSDIAANFATDATMGEVAITGQGAGTVATYPGGYSFTDFVNLADSSGIESTMITTQESEVQMTREETEKEGYTAGEIALMKGNYPTRTVEKQVQVNTPVGEVIRKGLKSGNIKVHIREYPVGKQTTDGSYIDMEKRVVFVSTGDADKNIGNVSGQTFEYSIPYDRIKPPADTEQ